MIAGSPDDICAGSLEIKCPTSANTYVNDIKDGKPVEKLYTQLQFQIYLTKMKDFMFCVADPDISENQNVKTLLIAFNEDIVTNPIINNFLQFWKSHVYPLLYQSIVNTVFRNGIMDTCFLNKINQLFSKEQSSTVIVK